ncbi:MAG: histidinol-phosphatase [Burkholderiales bacterium]
MRLALFDLDNTLLSGDSDFEWGLFLAAQGVYDREAYEAQNLSFYEAYKAGTLDIQHFLQFQLGPLARHSRDELNRWHARFMRERITPLISDKARALVREEQAHADLTAIVTATNRFVTGPIATAFGIEHLVATEPDIGPDGQFTGKARGLPCFREGKIACVDAWLTTLGQRWSDFDTTVFYSDSLNDLPLLERVSHPVAVNPDDTLRAHARAAHWPILELNA